MSTDGTPGSTTDFGEFGAATMQVVTTSEAAYFTVGVGNATPSTLYKAEAGEPSVVRSSDSLISSLTVHNDELYFVDSNAVYSLARGDGITEYLPDSQVIDIYQLFTLPSSRSNFGNVSMHQ